MAHKLLLSLFIIGSIISCTINDRDFQIKGVQADPTLVAPIASGDLSILDILSGQDSALIKVTSDGLLYLDYDTTLITQDIRKLIDIPSVNNLTTAVAVPPGTYPANPSDYTSTVVTKIVDMGISPEKLTEIAFKSGLLTYSMSLSPANSKFLYAVLISIPEFISNTTGLGFSQEVAGTNTIQLSGYTFKSATANKFTLKLTLIIKKNSQSATVVAGSNLNVNLSFTGMDFNYIKGFFGDQIANPPGQTIEVPSIGTTFHSSSATVSFAQPTIDFFVISDYGVPLAVTFTSLEARKQGSVLAMQTNPSSPIPITAPSTLGMSATTQVSVTNVKPVVDFKPTSFYYKVSGHINTGLSSGNNFMADTSKMRVRMHVQIPMYGKASNITLADTIDLDLGDVDQSKIDSASLKVNISNQLPLDANVQFILLDGNDIFIDSLLTASQTSIVKGSTVDANGELVTPGVVKKSIPLDLNRISKIFKAKKVIMKAKLNTSKNANGVAVDVKFKSQYKINVKLGLRTTIKLNANF